LMEYSLRRIVPFSMAQVQTPWHWDGCIPSLLSPPTKHT
jgi:hypothetical protein